MGPPDPGTSAITTEEEPNSMPRSKQGRGPSPRVAYFSMEIALESQLPTYSGGLGVLAGDSLRAAADLCLPMVGVTLVHREGYFRQSLDVTGRQTESPDPWAPEDRLQELGPRVQVTLGGHPVQIRAWVYTIRGDSGCEVPVYLLDTDMPENRDEDRALTDHLYGGDRKYRLLQEAVLGIGGVRMLRAAGHDRIHTFHLNEGHSALLSLALLEERTGSRGIGTANQRQQQAVKARCVFTTHTPVPAGHDRFEMGIVQEVLGEDFARAVEGRGTERDTGMLNMSELALFFSRWSNAVAFRHGEVSREMFPGHAIQAITNGVHVPTWTCPSFAELFDRNLPGWRADPIQLRHAVTLPLEAVREAHAAAKSRLLAAVMRRTGRRLDPDVFTLVFARRATPYKRADMLLSDPKRLAAIARRAGGLQLLYAGKAHPRDEGGKALIRRIFEVAETIKNDVPLVYLPNYDMMLGGLLSSGADVWLNTPEKPKEASGTSGMKASLNGVPNLSVLDGWWVEGHVEGVTGWALDEDWTHPADREVETEILYGKLENVVLPMFYKQPEEFDRMRRSAIALNGGHFTSRRMMLQYATEAYGLEIDLVGYRPSRSAQVPETLPAERE
jgi:starch phosphorylase